MSDIYQSRVFTFISKRTHRLKDSCAKGLRHLKVAVVWTGQILFYPLHLLAQTAKFLTHHPAPTPKALPQPAPELNVEQALEIVAAAGYEIELAQHRSIVVDDWSYIDDEIWQTGHGNAAVASREITYQPQTNVPLQIAKPIVRGLSSLLSDRAIVLVTTENEIMDVLNVFEQQEIRRRVGVDLAIDWHRWQQHQLPDRRAHNLPLATADLLLESVEPQQLSLLSGREATLKSERETLFDRFQNWLDSFKPKAEDRVMFAVEPSQHDDRLPPQLITSNYSFTPQSPSIDPAFELPQLPPVAEEPKATELNTPNVNNLSQLTPNWLKNWWNYYRDYVYIQPLESSQIVARSTSEDFQLIPLETEANKTTIGKDLDRSRSGIVRSPKTAPIDRKKHQDRAYNPEWLDIESEDLGHSRSIVRRLLMWLDGLMLKLENLLIKIWEFITNKPARN